MNKEILQLHHRCLINIVKGVAGPCHFNLTVLLRKLLQKNGAILQYLFSFSSPDYWAAIYMIFFRLIIIFLSHNSDYYIDFYRFWWMTYITQVIDSLEMNTRT